MRETLIILSILTIAAAPGSSGLQLHGEGYSLPATLELPETPGPCVVFFAGSGPTDRNWCSPLLAGKNGSAAQLAAGLRGKGIGSLRFDKVGSATNIKTLSVLSLDHYVEETMLAYDHLSHLKACTSIFLLGHSEGSLHATRAAEKAQNRPDFGGLIHMAGPSYSLADTMVMQLTPQAVASGMEPKAAVELMNRFRTALGNLPESATKPPDLSAFPMAGQLFGNIAAQAAMPQLQGRGKKGGKPFAVALLLSDPMLAVGAYRGPLLVMSGARDIQIPEENGIRITKASPSKRKERVVIADANHVFKHDPRDPSTVAATELIKAYAEKGRPLAKGVVEAIAKFIKGPEASETEAEAKGKGAQKP